MSRTVRDTDKKSPWRAQLPTFLGLGALLAFGNPAVHPYLGSSSQVFIQGITVPTISRWEASRLNNNYYEDLMRAGWFTSTALDRQIRPHFYMDSIEKTAAARRNKSFVGLELLPDQSVVFLGRTFSTNRWGMRDRDYERQRPPSTVRIAVLGPSHVMGLGVGDGETFEAVLEERLNSTADSERRYEVLNFGLSEANALAQLATLEQRVLEFEPNAVLYVAHLDRGWTRGHLIRVARHGIPTDYRYVSELIERLAIGPQTPRNVAVAKMRPHEAELLAWTYGAIVERCREHGILPLWMFLPLAGRGEEPADIVELHELAQQAGFETIEMSHVFDGHEASLLRVAPFDAHPNAAGHGLVAEVLLEYVSRHAELRQRSRGDE